MNKCDYGCNREAKHQYKNGKWCCSKSQNSCPGNRKIRREARKGYTAWNKDKKLSKEHIKNLSESHMGNIPSKETRIKMINSRLGENSYWYGKYKEESAAWKGGSVCYWHYRARKLFGKNYCETCGITNEDHKLKYKKRLDLHNTLQPKNYIILKQYVWKTLCKKCHIKLEHKMGNMNEHKKLHIG